MADILNLIKQKDLLAFSQNFSVLRPYKGNTIFPDQKTQNLEAEYYRLSQGAALPTVAQVHALDTEAVIGTRPGLEHITVEKFFIKEKINQSEKTREYVRNGVNQSNIISFIYDDMGRLADSVVARAELMKQTLLATGNLVVNENNLSFNINLGVPDSNKVTADWGDPEHNILGDIANWRKIAREQGQIITRVQTSDMILSYMQNNRGIQTQINGALGAGTFISIAQLNMLMQQMFGFTIETNEDIYATLEKQSDGTIKRKTTRFFPEDRFVMFATDASGALGVGLWGVTPEELSYGPWTEKSARQFVTITQWETPDPVALWTKASGLFVPVISNPEGIIIATITVDGSTGLDTLAVTSVAGTNSGDTKITVTPDKAEGNVYKYKTAPDCKLPEYGANVKTMKSWDGESDITATTGDEILIVEADSNYRAVKAGITTVTSQA